MATRRGLIAVAVLTGCAGAPPVAPVAAEALQAERLTIADQTLSGFTAEARFELTNSGETPMAITGATYELTMDGKPLSSGQVDLDQNAAPGALVSFRVPVTAEVVHNSDELKAMVARGDTPIPLLMKGAIKVSQGGSPNEIPFSRTGELRAPRLPVPRMNDTALGRTEQDVTVSFYFGLENQNPFEIKVKNITYKAEVDGKEIGAGTVSMGDRLPASQTAEYPIQENLTNLDRSKSEIVYHFLGTVDLGLAQVPIDLNGTMKFEASKSTHGKKKHKEE